MLTSTCVMPQLLRYDGLFACRSDWSQLVCLLSCAVGQKSLLTRTILHLQPLPARQRHGQERGCKITRSGEDRQTLLSAPAELQKGAALQFSRSSRPSSHHATAGWLAVLELPDHRCVQYRFAIAERQLWCHLHLFCDVHKFVTCSAGQIGGWHCRQLHWSSS